MSRHLKPLLRNSLILGTFLVSALAQAADPAPQRIAMAHTQSNDAVAIGKSTAANHPAASHAAPKATAAKARKAAADKGGVDYERDLWRSQSAS